MVPPIISFEADGGDVMVFSSAEDAASFLEPDYLDPSDNYYDGEGRLLEIACDRKQGITFHSTEKTPSHQEELQALLVEVFQRWFDEFERRGSSGVKAFGCSRDEIPARSLPQLIEICWRFLYQAPKKMGGIQF